MYHTVMTPEKRDAIRSLIGMYDTKSAQDIQEALKDLLGGTLKEMLESEMNEHIDYNRYQHSDNPDSRSGYKQKIVESSYGHVAVDVPQDRDSTFESKVVKKRWKDISEFEQEIISMYRCTLRV